MNSAATASWHLATAGKQYSTSSVVCCCATARTVESPVRARPPSSAARRGKCVIVLSPLLLLYARHGHAGDEPAPGEHEDQHQRRGQDRRRGHQRAVIGAGLG